MKKVLALLASLFFFLQCGCTAAEADYSSNTGTIDLTGMKVTGDGIKASEGQITITEGGDFTVTGENADCMIYVNAQDKVKLRLSGVNLKNANGPAIFFEQSAKSLITITENTENYIEDGSEYTEDAKAAIFSNDDLEIKGKGSLTVIGNYKHAIASDDDLTIENGTINITAAKDAIHVNDDFTLTDGTLTLSAGSDGIQAEKAVVIDAGTVTVLKCTEGIESGSTLTINGGIINITSSDDALNSGGGNGQGGFGFGGGMRMSPDGSEIPADGSMPQGGMRGGMKMRPDGSEIPADGSMPQGGMRGGMKMRPDGSEIPADGSMPQDGMRGGMNENANAASHNQDESETSTESTDCTLTINGGKITISTGGDGVDSNGGIVMSGGELYVSGPENSGNGAIDGNYFKVSGGTVFAAGSSGMSMGVTSGSTQQGILFNLSQTYAAGSEVVIKDSEGNELFSYTPDKKFSSVCFSAENLEENKSYGIYVNGELIKTQSPSYSNSGKMGGMHGMNRGGVESLSNSDRKLSVKISGQKINFTGAQPEIKNGTTLVPVRAVLEALGLDINWNSEKSEITAVKGNTTLVLTIGEVTAYKNGEKIMLGTAPEIKNSSAMVPVRFISEALGLSITWDENTRQVIIE